MLQTFTLKNGLKVATYSIPEMKSVYVDVTSKAGGLLDPKGKPGVAHFMEHLLIQGTPSFPTVEQLDDHIEFLAGSYNAVTSSKYVWFWINLPAKYIEEAFRISSEIVFEPLLPEESLERERGAILSEYHTRVDSLGYKLGRFYRDKRYKKDHPLLRDNIGDVKSITSINKGDLKSYWQKLFHPNNVYLIVVGGFDNKKIKKQAEDWFGKYKKGSKSPEYPYMGKKLLSESKVNIRYDPSLKSCYVDLDFASIPGTLPSKDFIPQHLIRSVMGGLGSSRLFRLLRQRKGLVYNVSFNTHSLETHSLVGPSCEVTMENLDETIELIVKELETFIKNGPTQEELDNARNYRVNKTLMEFDHPSNITDWVKGDLINEDRIYLPEEWVKEYEKITHDDLMKFMKKYWDLSKLCLTIQGPIKDSAANKKKYLKMIQPLLEVRS